MNTKELMIGDFVYSEYKERVIQVREVKNFSVIYEKESFSALGDGLQPIPLTDEILDKNAERCDLTYSKRWKMRKPGKLYLEIYNWSCCDDHYEVFNGVEIGYVHELQHVLRLCGEYELADNLKIE